MARQVSTFLKSPTLWSVLLAPLVFFGWMLVGPQTLGNDYQVYQVEAALSLRAYTAMGIEPMWFPHLTGGFPMGGLSLAQAWHPVAWLSSLLPGWWSGHAIEWLTVRHLLLLALAHGLHYLGCRRLAALPPVPSAFVAFACVYNLRTLDEFRYGTALEAAVYGHGVVLVAAWYVVAPSPWRLVAVGALVQLLITCGYPVLLPFTALAAVVMVPPLWARVGAGALARRLAPLTAAALAGVALAAPHWLPFTEWLAVNASRVLNPTLRWASHLALDGPSLWANVVAPWAADAPSAFAGSALVVLVILATAVALSRCGVRAALMLPALLFPFAYALGAASPVYRFFFDHVPGFASLRTPGRVFDMVPLLLIAALAWIDAVDREHDWPERLRRSVPTAAALQLLALIGGVGQGVLTAPAELPRYAPASLLPFWTAWPQAGWWVCGIVACAAALLASRRPRASLLVLAVCTVVQTAMLMRHGTWVEQRKPTPTLQAFRDANHLPLLSTPPWPAENALMEGSVGTATTSYTMFIKAAGPRANCYLPVDPGERHRGVLLPFYLSHHTVCVPHRRDALARIAEDACRRGTTLRTLVVSPACVPSVEPTSNAALADVNRASTVRALGPNGVVLTVDAPVGAVLVTPYPDATDNWRATLDGKPVPLLQVNGGFHGVAVPAGRHEVALWYFSPRTVSSWRIAGAGFAMLAAAAAWIAARGRLRPVARLGVAAVVGLLATVAAGSRVRELEQRAHARPALAHDYPAVLQEQLERWTSAP